MSLLSRKLAITLLLNWWIYNKPDPIPLFYRYAYLMESIPLRYQLSKHCDLMEVGGELDSKGYGLAVPKNSPYRDSLSNAILSLSEQQVLLHLYNKWWNVSISYISLWSSHSLSWQSYQVRYLFFYRLQGSWEWGSLLCSMKQWLSGYYTGLGTKATWCNFQIWMTLCHFAGLELAHFALNILRNPL